MNRKVIWTVCGSVRGKASSQDYLRVHPMAAAGLSEFVNCFMYANVSDDGFGV